MIITRQLINGMAGGVAMIFCVSMVVAEEMDHSKHKMQDHSGHNMKEHSEHDTGSATHIHHQHGKGGWMFEFRIMHMVMDGLLDGTDSVSSEDISGSVMGTPPMKRMDKDYMMSPTSMDMDMAMFMVMYGITDDLSIMGMFNYQRNDMDMVMHMYMNQTAPMIMNSAESNMKTDGVGDTIVTAMYDITHAWSTSLGLSFPTGSIDEKVTMMGQEQQAPYRMQLGSGTYDLIPAFTFKKTSGKINWGAQFEYTYRPGTNDNEYNLGDRWEVTAWAKQNINSNVVISGRVEYSDWSNIDGQDPNINPMMTPAGDPDTQGGKRADLLLGVNSMFGSGHMVGGEIGLPFYQNLDGPQLATDYIISIAYQYMM